MTEVHHDLALILDVVDGLLQRRELGVGEVEGDADDRLPVGAGPFVAEVAGRVEAAEPLRRKLAVELGDVLLEHRPLELQAEVLDLHFEEAPRLRRRLLERVHGGHGTGFEHVVGVEGAPEGPHVEEAARHVRQSVAVLDEPFLVVTFKKLEVVDWSMASPAPVEAPVQRGGFRCPSSGMIRFVKRCSRCGTSCSTSTSSSLTKKPTAPAAAGRPSSTSSRTARASR